MKFNSTDIPDVLELMPRMFEDDRGVFFESFRETHFREVGINFSAIQINQSHSVKGVLRGLHCQNPYPQAKIVRVLSGEVFDVAVDVREKSATFGKWVGVTLTAKKGNQLFIPEGFAHGFLVLSDTADVEYLCNNYYHPAGEIMIRWDDPSIGIKWPLKSPKLSTKDAQGHALESYLELENKF